MRIFIVLISLLTFSVRPAPLDLCDPSPCGNNALCTVHDGAARCTCIPPYIGNAYIGCKPECLVNSDCSSDLSCLNQHCRNPCLGVCGNNAQCEVINHIPICSCLQGYIGDPFQACKVDIVGPKENPCSPSLCGPYSVCRVVNDRAVCSCSPGFYGVPPMCRPECVVNSECPQHLACIEQKCSDPCPGSCGLNAYCHVSNHNPLCSCPPGYTGYPLVECSEDVAKGVGSTPCLPSPCGPNAECRVNENRAVCSCMVGMFGAPPNCRPECIINQDCPNHLACLQSKCSDPCMGSCGYNAKCSAQNHRPVCECYEGYEGDALFGCNLKGTQLS